MSLRNHLDIFASLREIISPVEFFEKRQPAKILVLSPHPDDEIFGCGGTLYQHHLRGNEITAVYMTDGRKGNPAYSADILVSIRQEEAKRAAAILGINRQIFLDNKDSELSCNHKTTRELSDILKECSPDAVLLPFLLDNHTDHMATNRILLSAVNSLPSFLCCAYPVWTPLPLFNLSVDITPYIEVKKMALQEFKSQIEVFDLVGVSLSLSRYFSFISGNNNSKGWAEVYIVCTSHEYMRLARAIGW